MFKIFKNNKGEFYSSELEPIYYVKTLNTNTNELKMMVVSWYRIDVESPFIRVYDLEIENEKFLFYIKYQEGLYFFEPKKGDLENLKYKYGIEILSEEEVIN